MKKSKKEKGGKEKEDRTTEKTRKGRDTDGKQDTEPRQAECRLLRGTQAGTHAQGSAPLPRIRQTPNTDSGLSTPHCAATADDPDAAVWSH